MLLLINEFPVVLIVDELDRCLPEHAIKVLERLHHLDMESNIVQVVAINKTSMSFGIAKAYGRYDLLNEPSEGNLKISRFSDEYFKKLFDVFLVLGSYCVNEERADLLFDGEFLKGFRAYKRDDIIARMFSFNIDMKYFADFYLRLFDGIDIRNQKRIMNLVQNCHKITVEDARSEGMSLYEFEYQHLIWEILVCINFYTMAPKKQSVGWFRKVTCSERQNFPVMFSIGLNPAFNDDSFSKTISGNLVKIFSENKNQSTDNNSIVIWKDPNNFPIFSNESFILAYYCVYCQLNIPSFYDSTYNMLAEKIINEQPFLKLFQHNMELLIG